MKYNEGMDIQTKLTWMKMAGKRRVSNGSKKLTSSAKTMKITKNISTFSEDDLELHEENLDYEADDENLNHIQKPNKYIAEGKKDVVANGKYLLIDFSKAKKDFDKFSVSHKSDMIRYNKTLDSAKDGRQDDYFIYSPKRYKRIILNSSSSSDSSDNESYSMTHEEEDRLLQSESDSSRIESEENYVCNSVHPYKRTAPVMNQGTSEITNKVYAPEKKSLSNKVEKNNDVQQSPHIFQSGRVIMKGENIIIKARNDIKNGFRPWNVHYKPYPFVTLFLKDLGYIAPCKPRNNNIDKNNSCNSDKSDISNIDKIGHFSSDTGGNSNSEQSHMEVTSFKVILGANHERTCKQIQQTSQSYTESGFKVPLPPIKRPPTRPKRSVSNVPSLNSSASSSDISEGYSRENRLSENCYRTNVFEPPKEDDVISLTASSIVNFEIQEDKSDFIREEDESTLREIQRTPNYNRPYVENWITSLQTPPPSNPNSPRPLMEISSLPLIQFIKKTETEENRGKIGSHINYKTVHPYFSGICYRYYFENKCSSRTCFRSHRINVDTFARKCVDLTKTHMQKIYSFSLRFHILFKEIYPALLRGFAIHNMQADLLACIEDFFALKAVLDPGVAVKQIVDTLKSTGLTFLEAIEKISFNVSFVRHPESADVLLELLTEKPNVSENWEEIKRISRGKSYIPAKFVERIISKVLVVGSLQINKDLCKDIFHFITNNKMTDLSEINPELLTPLKTLAQFGSNNINLPKRFQRFERPNQESLAPQIETISNVIDFDDRVTFPQATITSQIQNESFFSSRDSTSKSSTSSSRSSRRYSNEPEKLNESLSPEKESFQYVPQTITPPKETLTTLYNNRIETPIPSPPPPPLISNMLQRNNQTFSYEINLFPDIPIFGKFKYRPEFCFQESLHNLLQCSDPNEQVPMYDPDIVALNDVIKRSNGDGFLSLLHQYKGPNTVKHFITMSIAHLKSYQNPYKILINLIANIEAANPGFKYEPLLKGVFEVIVFNILFLFERKCYWADARKAIEAFCDWDSLISSMQFALKTLTPVGRYIFLATLLTKSKAYNRAYDILHSPGLRLLESSISWPLFHTSADIQTRNLLLTDFFKYAYLQNIELICHMYRNIIQFGDIWDFDALTFFNPMLVGLLDRDNMPLLKHFYNDINIFYKKMNKNVLRAFVIYFGGKVSTDQKFKLYEMAAEKGIYSMLTGRERTIIVRTNMPDFELKLLLMYYMHKRAQIADQNLNYGLQIEIGLPVEITKSPAILSHCLRSPRQVNYSIQNLLNYCFDIRINNAEPECTVIEVTREQISAVL